jgi:hypothetical protein
VNPFINKAFAGIFPLKIPCNKDKLNMIKKPTEKQMEIEEENLKLL